jgi:acetyl-CoA carboxylase biotin carboxyl carrier protein
MDVERIEALLKVLSEQKVSEFNYEDEHLTVSVSFGGAVPVVTHAPAAVPVTVAAAPAVSGAPAEAPLSEDPSLKTMESPMVGTFYRSPAPDADPFVKLGDRVRCGQTLCIIEAMKLMNEIEAEMDGVISAILVDNAQPVQFGQPLFKIKAD